MHWFITGGCGFIGTSLIQQLLKQQNNCIRVLDNLSVGALQDLAAIAPIQLIHPTNITTTPWSNQHVQFIQGDILDESLALQITTEADVIVHLAANTGVGPSVENPRADCLANVIGTFNYLEAARTNHIKRFIFASSGAPAGEVEPPIHEELPPHPVSPYGASKLAGEGYCSAYKRTYDINTVALRFGNVYGPGSKHKSSVVAKFIRQALAGQALEIYGDGHQTRDFIYIDDLVNAILLAATTKNIGGETFQIATNQETTILTMYNILLGVLNKKGISNIELINNSIRLGDVKRNYSDNTKARNILGWIPYVPLEIGIQNTVEYFIKKV